MSIQNRLNNIKKTCGNCQNCALFERRNNVVFSNGKDSADIMIVGEAPGKNEDLTGEPFCGVAGQLFNDYLKKSGLNRDEFYITNILKCRPTDIERPNKDRVPKQDEINKCIHFLYEQIEIINPKLIVLAGGTALKTLTGKKSIQISKVRGQFFDLNINGKIYKATAIFHPSYLRQYATEVQKEQTLSDLGNIKRIYFSLQG